MPNVYTTPPTWANSTPISVTLLNQLIGLGGNTDFLFHKIDSATTMSFQNASDYSSSSTSFVDVDATNAKITATLQSTKAIVLATFMLSVVTGGSVGGFAQILSSSLSTNGGSIMGVQGGGVVPITLWGYWTGLTPGSNTFKLQYRTNNAGNAVSIKQTAPGWPITMMIWEP